MTVSLKDVVVEQRSCFVRKQEPRLDEWPDVTPFRLREVANEIGMQPLDLSWIRYLLRQYAEHLEHDAQYVTLGFCDACGVSHRHVAQCPRVNAVTHAREK